MFCLRLSSLTMAKSKVRSSRNLYSIFWMKSRRPEPSFCKNRTAKYLQAEDKTLGNKRIDILVRLLLTVVKHSGNDASQAEELEVELLVVAHSIEDILIDTTLNINLMSRDQRSYSEV